MHDVTPGETSCQINVMVNITKVGIFCCRDGVRSSFINFRAH
jgi:hypothetical protein